MLLLNYTTAEHRARFAERLAAAMASQCPDMTHVSVKKYFSVEEGCTGRAEQ